MVAAGFSPLRHSNRTCSASVGPRWETYDLVYSISCIYEPQQLTVFFGPHTLDYIAGASSLPNLDLLLLSFSVTREEWHAILAFFFLFLYHFGVLLILLPCVHGERGGGHARSPDE